MSFQKQGKAHQKGQPRARPINSCLTCRDRKKGCDRKQPICGNCTQSPDPSKPCVYYALGKAEVLKNHKRRMQSLKEDFASNIARGVVCNDSQIADSTAHTSLTSTTPSNFTREQDLDDGPANCVIRIGKLRVSDRIGGAFCPITREELTDALETSAHLYPEEPLLSHQCPLSIDFTETIPLSLRPISHCCSKKAELYHEPPSLLARRTSETLLAHYWDCVHPIARVLHWPSFTVRWEEFWDGHELGKQVDKYSSALVSTVLLAALESMTNDVVKRKLRNEKNILMQQMQARADEALAQSNWIHSTQIEALQAVVIYLITACRDDVSHAHSSIVAAAIRAAEGMGLHEDEKNGDYDAIQVHLRRLLWYQLLVLDIKTCETTGLRPQKRKGEFSTRIPLNINEDWIQDTFVSSHEWTDITATIIQFRCNEFIREIWSDCLRLKDEQISIDNVLIKIRTFDVQIQNTFEMNAELDVPIQHYSHLIARALISSMYVMVLRQYTVNPSIAISENLKKILVKYGIQTMDAVRELETSHELAKWRWLSGAIQQHHTALVMLLELLKNPYSTGVFQIMKGLDNVFEPPAKLYPSPLIHIRGIAIQLRDQMDLYTLRGQLNALQESQKSQDVPDLDYLDAWTSSSFATPGNTSPATQTSSRSDEQQAYVASVPHVSIPVQLGKRSYLNSISRKAFPDQRCKLRTDSKNRLIDIDAKTMERYFPDILETSLTMNASERNTTYAMSCSTPNLSTPSQVAEQNLADKKAINDLPDSSCNPKVAEPYTDKSLEEPGNPYATFYNIDDFTGYCETLPVNFEPLVSTSAAYPFNSHLNSPFDSFPNVPSQQAMYSGPALNNQQQHHQVQPIATLNLFRNDSEPSTRSASHPHLVPQAFHPQLTDSMDYGILSYDAMDV